MPVVTMKQLLEAGVHFGHQTRRWNPKMRRFIFGERNGIYIIDLNQTLERINTAYTFVRDLVAEGGTILFVGTKKQTQDPIADHARKCGMPYINERWLGGMLTNFSTISARVKKMQEYERMKEAGDFEAMPKKEALILSRELEKLQRNLGGIRNLTKLPDAVFIIDTKKEHIAVTEANKLGLPIVAVVDTNCDPDLIQYVIPGNDDAIRAGNLMCRIISDAVEEGRLIASRRERKAAAAHAPEADPEAEARRAHQQAEARRQAALQAQEREARLAATRRHQQAIDIARPGDQMPAATVTALSEHGATADTMMRLVEDEDEEGGEPRQPVPAPTAPPQPPPGPEAGTAASAPGGEQAPSAPAALAAHGGGPTEPEAVLPTEPEAPAEPEVPTEPEAVVPTEPEVHAAPGGGPTEPEAVVPTEPEAAVPTEPEAVVPTEPEVPAELPSPVGPPGATDSVTGSGLAAEAGGEDRSSTAEFTAKDVQRLRQVSGAGMMDAKRALMENDGDFEAAARWLREKGLAKAVEKAERANDQGAVAVASAGRAYAIVELKCETDYVAKSPDFKAMVDTLARAVAAEGEPALSAHQDAIDDLRLSLKENIAVGRVVRFEAGDGAVVDSYLHVQNGRGVNAVLVEVVGGDQGLAHDVALHVGFARPRYLSRDEVPAELVAEERRTLETISRNEGKPEQAVPKIVEGRLNAWYKEHVLLDQPFVKDNKQTVSDFLGPARITRFAQVEIGR